MKSLTPKRALLASAVASTFAVTAMPAHAFEASLSGQINRIANYIDDGDDTEILFQDCTCTGTRFRIQGSQDVGENYKAGGVIELQYQSNAGSGQTINTDGIVGGPSTSNGRLRKTDIWISGGFGKLSLGQGDGAANGTSEHDLSDTWIASYNAPSGAGGQLLTLSNGGGQSTTSVYAVTSQYDGLSRNDRVRYDTPALGPVTLSASAGTEFEEVAARLYWEGEGGTAVSAGVGIVQSDPGNIDQQWNYAVSILFTNGFNVTWSQGERTLDNPGARGNDDADTWHFKLGWRLGEDYKHAVSIAVGEDNDRRVNGETGERFDLAYIHNWADGIKMYVGFNTLEVDTPGGNIFNDVDSLFAGARFTF